MDTNDTDTSPAPLGRLAALQAQLDAAKASAKAEESQLSDEDREEIELRRKLSAEREKAAELKAERRQLDLDRRLDAARAKDDLEGVPLSGLLIAEYPDAFVIRAHQSAYQRWSEAIAKAGTRKKIDRQAATRQFAVAAVVDWNGHDLSSPLESDQGLVQYLKKNPGIATSIVNEAATLTGAFNQAQKS